jgi:hypothetical protein
MKDKMDNIHLLDIIRAAEETKVSLDFYTLLVIFIVLWFILGRSPELLIVILILFLVLYGANETFGIQSISVQSVEGCIEELRVENKSYSPFALGFKTKVLLHVPIIFSGVVQTINRLRGDQRYMLSRELGTSLVINSTDQVIYRTGIRGEIPKRILFISQHSPLLFDTFPFLTYIPTNHKLTILNDFTQGLKIKFIGKIWNSYAQNLCGSHPIDRSNKKTLKTQVSNFVDLMLKDEQRIFAIWASGRLWNKDLPNGLEKFNLGAFYMSAYSGIPVCVIHGRLSNNSKRFIVEQSPLYYPPTFNTREDSYIKFYENTDHRKEIEEYRNKIEALYRNMDDRIYEEVNK